MEIRQIPRGLPCNFIKLSQFYSEKMKFSRHIFRIKCSMYAIYRKVSQTCNHKVWCKMVGFEQYICLPTSMRDERVSSISELDFHSFSRAAYNLWPLYFKILYTIFRKRINYRLIFVFYATPKEDINHRQNITKIAMCTVRTEVPGRPCRK